MFPILGHPSPFVRDLNRGAFVGFNIPNRFVQPVPLFPTLHPFYCPLAHYFLTLPLLSLPSNLSFYPFNPLFFANPLAETCSNCTERGIRWV